MPRSPVTSMVEQYNALTEVEQKVFLDLVDPQPEPEAPAKQTRKKRGKSAKAQSLSTAISRTPKADTDADEAAERAHDIISPKCGICGNEKGHADHDRTYIKSHDFEAPKSVADAAKKSSRKGAETNSTVNTEGEKANALAVGASGD